ncbi:zinc ribbon domain-containing protein [Patescibacteria group bacterium]|nr:zinc ribbon domain-containing protein [Patescibacteria group bacterium]
MKRFCSQCGKELEKNILICPKCGYKNAKKGSKKKLTILIIVIAILITLGVIVYAFRDQIISIVENPLEFIAQIKDPDYKAKQEYKGVYERYLVEIRYYSLTYGYQQTSESENKETAEKLKKDRENLIEYIDEINCFSKINLDSNCDTLLNELRDTEEKISNLISKDFFFPPYDCKICQTELEDLLRIVGTVQSSELSDLLFSLTTDLKTFNNIELKTVEIRTTNPYQYNMFFAEYFLERSEHNKARKEFINQFNEQVSLINGIWDLNLSKIIE